MEETDTDHECSLDDQRGRGKGWEERIQHKLLTQFFSGKQGITCHHEFPIPIPKFANSQAAGKLGSVRADLVVDFGSYYEIIECKGWNHPIFDLATAFGQVATYRALMETRDIFPNNERKEIQLGLCLIDGYPSKCSKWTQAHDELLKALARLDPHGISLYLACPISPEYAGKEHWDNLERQHVVLRSYR